MRTHILDLPPKLDPQFHRVYRTDRVRDCALRMFADGQRRFHRRLQISHVVHRIKNAEYVNTIGRSAFDEFLHDIIGIVAITEDVLTAK